MEVLEQERPIVSETSENISSASRSFLTGAEARAAQVANLTANVQVERAPFFVKGSLTGLVTING